MSHPFSPNEMRVIRELKPRWAYLMDRDEWDRSPFTTLDLLAQHCFANDIKNAASEAFRNAYKHLIGGKTFRGTTEYEQLLNY